MNMHHDHIATPQVTRAQMVAMTLATVLALLAGILSAVSFTNLSYSTKEMGGLIMPPGMIMTRNLPAAAMRDMAAVDLRQVSYRAPAEAQGDRLLEPSVAGDVKVFDLELSVIQWHILPGVEVAAYAFNRQVPGPRLQLTEGDRVRLRVRNNLPEPTSVHWHGLVVPNLMDGAAEITQPPIAPGESFTYEFEARQHGTFFYHSHAHVDRQQALGLYGALIIAPKEADARPAAEHDVVIQLQEWTHKEGFTFPAMPMEGALPNYFTINGKAYPATETVRVRQGERVRFRFIGSQSAFIHPMHLHGGPFTIMATDGYPVPPAAQWVKDTLNVGPGERYDVIWEAREPGQWLLHCHINHHTTNNNAEEAGGGGLMLVIEVTP